MVVSTKRLGSTVGRIPRVICAAVLPLALGLVVLGCQAEEPFEVEQSTRSISAYCSVLVSGVGWRAVETDYLPHVVQCENGNAPLQALKAQAVAARTFMYYKIDTTGSIGDGQHDQVYSCGRTPTALHHQAVQETAGQVLRYSNTTICSFYVAGAIPPPPGCVATSSSPDPTNTEHYVTYNWGRSGTGIIQTTLGWVNPGNVYNRGCKSQNGAACLAGQGWGYENILRFYYGMDIELHQATGSCVTPTECSPGQTQTQACGNCGTRSRTCQGSGLWGAFGACTGQGVCAPGTSQSEACGNCGTRSRTCTASCTWNAWSACAGQGVCAPGTAESRDCCDCGTEQRTCQAFCQWSAWSTCAGPDPGGGTEVCQTGQPGICAEGRTRCVAGCLVCQRIHEPRPELCNDLDDDCSGQVDNGAPEEMGHPPPAYAARILDYSVPRRITPGESASAWILFENVGHLAWAPGEVWLTALAPASGTPSLFVDPSWPAHDVVAVLLEDVAPGGRAEVTFTLSASADLSGDVTETFGLLSPTGRLLACPSPSLTVTVGPRQRRLLPETGAPPGTGPAAASRPTPSEPWIMGGCSVGAGGSSNSLPSLPWLFALLLLVLLRRPPPGPR